MPVIFNVFSGILIFSGIVNIILSATLFTKYQKIGKYASILLLLSAWWSISSAICLMQRAYEPLWLVVKLQYFSVALFPGFWILFVLKFLKWETKFRLLQKLILFLVPFCTIAFVFSNDLNHLYYKTATINIRSGIALFAFEKGPWYYVHTLYFYGCIISGLVLLRFKTDRANYIFSAQTSTIFLAVVVPAIANLLYLFGFRPASGVDLTPFAFAVTTVVIAYSIIKYNLFELLPVAREKVIDSLQEGVIVLDNEDRIVFLNPAIKRYIKIDEKLEGIAICKLFPDLHADNNQTTEVEISNGILSRKIFAVTSSALENDNKVLEGRILLFKDITERKRTEELLIAATDEALKASQAKADFLSTMSHEIRTPMNAVIGFTTLLQQNAREDQKEYLDLLKYSGENLLVLINDILDFSKIEAGKVELEKADFKLAELIDKIRLTFLHKAAEKGIELKAVVDSNLPETVIGDPLRLGQILTNLVGNAIKFTETGGVSIILRSMATSAHEAKVGFEIKDTGIGIASDRVHSIFESFTQASSDTTRKFGGTGLGLAISKKLVELYGGTISVESEQGKGSSFKFNINFEVSLATNQVDRKNAKNTFKSLKGIKVLLAEDNRINVVLARQFLKQWEVACEVAENGSIALEMIKQMDFDAVLMDLQMPEMDGFTSAKAIRALPEEKYKTVPIIALSAAALTEEMDKVFASGMNDFVTKPFKPDDLYEKLNFYCLKARAVEI